MYCCDNIRLIAACALLLAGVAQADGGYILGFNVEADTADGRAVNVFADLGITDSTRVSASLGRTNTGSDLTRLETFYADLGFEHSLGMFGARAGAAYWGDGDILDSNDLRGALFMRGRNAGLTLDLQRRDFDLVFERRLDSSRPRQVEFSADGIGMSGWIRGGERVTFYASGMRYEYSRDIRLTDNIELLNFLSRSRLSLINSLVDHRFSVGTDIAVGLSLFDLSVAQWQTAIDGGKVNSVALGYTRPVGPLADVEFRLAVDDSENFGRAVAFAVGFYFFGD